MPTSLTGPPDSIWQVDPENCEICNQMQDTEQNQVSPITDFAAYVARSVAWLLIMQLLLQRDVQLTTLTTILSHVAVQAQGRAGRSHKPGANWPGDAFSCHMLTDC